MFDQGNGGDQGGGQEDFEPRLHGKPVDGDRNPENYETRTYRRAAGFRMGRALHIPRHGVLLGRRLVQVHQEEESAAGIRRQVLPPTNRFGFTLPKGKQRLAS